MQKYYTINSCVIFCDYFIHNTNKLLSLMPGMVIIYRKKLL